VLISLWEGKGRGGRGIDLVIDAANMAKEGKRLLSSRETESPSVPIQEGKASFSNPVLRRGKEKE